MAKEPYHRVLLKVSGEALTAEGQFGVNGNVLKTLAERISEAAAGGTQIGIMVGGGNIWRYRDHADLPIERVTSDQMGMLAAAMNALALQSAIEQVGGTCRVQSAITMPQVAEQYIRRRAIRHLEKGRIVIFAAGVGQPYFTTDTGAALRALEIEAEVLLKGSKVDGIYDRDPKANKSASRYDTISYGDVLEKNLQVMDATAVSLCRENNLPIIIFNIFKTGSLAEAISGASIGTEVHA